ncbi:MAG: hypothetical protein R3213_12120 [Flavobacteriaceae bacterium]|nr:hypothetical protein [Flavobacteriaceae bacterium]
MINISNPPECLENYIVLKDGCYCDSEGNAVAAPTPISGFYIEALQGLSLENLSDITPENIKTTELVNNMVYFAAKKVEKRLTGYLSSNGFNLNKKGKLYEACKVQKEYSIPVALDRGVRVSKATVNSSQAVIFVEQIRIKSKIDGPTTLKIEDENGVLLWSKSVSLTAEIEQHIKVNEKFEHDVIFVLADSTNVSLYEYNCQYEGGCCNKRLVGHQDLSVMGFDGNQNSFIGYLGVCVRLDCQDKDIICQFLDRLQMAILAQTGVEILEEWLAPSSRINLIKTFGREWAETKKEEFMIQSIEWMEAELEAIEDILAYDEYCFHCENRLTSIPMLPS